MEVIKFDQFRIINESDEKKSKYQIEYLVGNDGEIVRIPGIKIDVTASVGRRDQNFENFLLFKRGQVVELTTAEYSIVSNNYDVEPIDDAESINFDIELLRGVISRNDVFEIFKSHSYPLAVDKGGTILAPFKYEEANYVYVIRTDCDDVLSMYTDEKEIQEIDLKDRYHIQYLLRGNLSKTPTGGWVNIKIDDDLYKKVRRFSILFDTGKSSVDDLTKKLQMLSNISNNVDVRDVSNLPIRKKLALITLLKIMDEIKNKQNPTNAGFLIEPFFAALIDGSSPDNNMKYDIEGDDQMTYQSKFVDNKYGGGVVLKIKRNIFGDWNFGGDTRSICKPLLRDNKNGICDYFLIGLKSPSSVDIYIIEKYLLRNYIVDNPNVPTDDNPPIYRNNNLFISEDKNGLKISVDKLVRSNHKFINIRLDNCDEIIKKVFKKKGAGIDSTISELYNGVSNIEYKIESVTTGITEEYKILDNYKEYDEQYRKATEAIDKLKNDFQKLIEQLS